MNFVFYLHDESSKDAFERKILWFKRKYQLISINDLRALIYGGKPFKNACMLSVDDGWRSTYDVIYPIMKKHNVPFTVFVSPEVMKTGMNFWYYTIRYCDEAEIKDMIVSKGFFSHGVQQYPLELIFKELLIDDVYAILNEYQNGHPELKVSRGFMNTEEVLELHNSGLVEIGAHTMVHPILQAEDEDRSHREIVQSVESLSAILKKPVTCFAYPNGLESVDFSEREKEFCKNVGIDMAFSVNPGAITKKTDPLSIPRWGSISRLRFGRLGMYLPSRANQINLREEIRRFKIQ